MSRRSNTKPMQASASPLDDLPLYLPRLYYAFLGVVELHLKEMGLDRHLQPGMGHVLFRLYEGDNCIIKDISQSLRIANGTLTGLLKRMEKAGLIQCRRCTEDGRATRVLLTPLGRSLRPKLEKFHRKIVSIIEQGLTPEEVRQSKELMARMLGSLRSEEEGIRDTVRQQRTKTTNTRKK